MLLRLSQWRSEFLDGGLGARTGSNQKKPEFIANSGSFYRVGGREIRDLDTGVMREVRLTFPTASDPARLVIFGVRRWLRQ